MAVEYVPLTNLRGPAARIVELTAVTLPPGQPATADMTGPDQGRKFALGIPQGPRGLPGVNGVPTDEAVAGNIEAVDSLTGQAVLNATGVLSAASYIVGDGVVDDSDGLITAASAASTFGLTLLIPPLTPRITKTVTMNCPVRSEATFLAAANSNGRIVLGRSGSPVLVTPGGVGGLSKGSTQLTGIPGAGTLVIESTEELIKRYQAGPSTPYTKQESVRVGADGTIFPPLDNTYDTAQITSMTLYPPDAPAVATGIHVVVDGAVAGANDNFVTINRSNLDVEGLRVLNASGKPLTCGVRVQDSVSVRFFAPRVDAFDLSTAGYGIAKYRSSDITITDAQITRCRHAVTGRYENRVLLLRGFYGGGVDTHWGTGLVANDINSQVAASGSHFLVAGGSVTVVGGRFFQGRNLVGVRADTPELSGAITIRESVWTCDASTVSAPTPWVAGYSTINDGGHGYNFGRVLAAPSVKITDVTLILPTGRVAYGLHAGEQSYQRGHFPEVEIDNLRVVNPGVRVVAADLVKSATTLPDAGVATKLTVRRVSFPVGNDGGIYIRNVADTAGGALFTVLIEDSVNVAIKVPEPSVSSMITRRSRVIQVMRVAASVQAFAGVWRFEQCEFAAPTFNGYWKADFLNNEWSGAVTVSQDPVNSRVKSLDGNRVVVGATGYPSLANGYRNPAFYI